ncbi:hypothetical protein Nizo2259_3191 [Lactiplantibacillus plantarum]|nr:hypothetical protein Nizo2259_3191 [Lactiplantibacillus plantarum]
MLLKKHFGGGNSQELGEETFTGNMSINTIELLNQQLAIKDIQIKEKDEQLKSMQKLLDQSQQLQLMTEKKLEELKETSIAKNDLSSDIDKTPLPRKKYWWKFW